jgi:hypothetical protein
MDYSSETGTFASTHLPTLTGGDTWSISYNATDVVLTVNGPGAADGVADDTHDPLAILSRATCFGARLLMASAACGSEALATSINGGERRATATAGIKMVATRTISTERGGGSQKSSASATAMARLYVCAYFPSSIAHAIGCN